MKTINDIKNILKIELIDHDDCIITHITSDSRDVMMGSLFICLDGEHVDGHDYIDKAIEKGAVAILCSKDVDMPSHVCKLKVENTREAMKVIVPFFYDYPANKMRMIGVTGTNGKTTVTHLVKHILEDAGYKTGLIGTIHSMIGNESYPTHNTTPDVVELQQLLAKMIESGVSHCIMEVSSHALALGRVAGIEYDTAVFTNLTQDHLDFHENFENYLAAKASLFSSLSEGSKKSKTAVININDDYGNDILAQTPCFAMTYGTKGGESIEAMEVKLENKSTSFQLYSFGEVYSVNTQLVGMFNVYNVLAALGVSVAEGINIEKAIESVNKFVSVPGRFEPVEEGQDFSVIVDYAHTPDGLENILKTARTITKQKIVVVFGCGGDRDRTKRPIMGKLAATWADYIIVTSDNPRTEDPLAIVDDIKQGILDIEALTSTYEIIVDRKEAIYKAISLAEKGDIVLIAGKGHEDYQILKDETIHFDDREIAREALQRRA